MIVVLIRRTESFHTRYLSTAFHFTYIFYTYILFNEKIILTVCSSSFFHLFHLLHMNSTVMEWLKGGFVNRKPLWTIIFLSFPQGYYSIWKDRKNTVFCIASQWIDKEFVSNTCELRMSRENIGGYLNMDVELDRHENDLWCRVLVPLRLIFSRF